MHLSFADLFYHDAGTDPFTSGATPASENDASKLTPTPSMRKTRTAVKRQGSMSFEDMGEFIRSMHLSFADLFYRDAGTDLSISGATSASENDTSKLTPTPSMRKTGVAVKQQGSVRFEDTSEFIWTMYIFFADLFYHDCRHHSVPFWGNSDL